MATAALTPIPASAVEIPGPSLFVLQTPDRTWLPPWGTGTRRAWPAPAAGAGYDYVTFTVPCGWPAATPVYVDMFSPEVNRVAGALAQSEEPNGNYDSTQYELYGPGATIGPGFRVSRARSGHPGHPHTYQPALRAWRRRGSGTPPLRPQSRAAPTSSDPRCSPPIP